MYSKGTAIVLFLGLSIYFMKLCNAPLKKLHGRIIKLEFTTSLSGADEILENWKGQRSDWQSLLLESLHWDTWLICSYVPLSSLLCWVAADYLKAFHPAAPLYGHTLAAAQIFAGVCDFIENAGLRRTIVTGAGSSPWVQITATASIIKWLLLALSVIFVTSAAVHWLVQALSG